MRMRPDLIEFLANSLVHQIKEQRIADIKKEHPLLVKRIIDLITQNFEEEDRLQADALKLFEQNKRKIGLNIDENRALQMIKKQLAKERNFVL